MNKFPNPNIHVITGKVQGGKATFLASLVEGLRKHDLRIAGFLSRESVSGERGNGFTLVDLEGGRQVPLASLDKRKGWFGFRRLYFNPAAFIMGERWVRNGLLHSPDLVVIDEVGPMEMEGLGWWKILIHLEDLDHIVQLWIVREQILSVIKEKWRIPDENIYWITDRDQDALIERLSSDLISARKN